MCELFQFAVDSGKKVYLISDMYYPKDYLEKLLFQNGITGYTDLFVSCDVKKEKSDGSLFQWYLTQAESGKNLHIGDNRRADIQKATESGIDTYHIYSAYELLMASSVQEILSEVKTLQQRCILGLVISRIFNNPFALHSSKGYVAIHDIQDIGYCFVAPMLTEFIKWFLAQVNVLDIEQVLFPSRDGYLIQKVFEILSENKMDSTYFRTSRRAVSVTGIRDIADIRRIASRKYQGTCREFLKTRFGIEIDFKDERSNLYMIDFSDADLEILLLDYEDVILKSAGEERLRYIDYLDKKDVLSNKRQVLFDFGASGTVQYNLSRLLERDIRGLYFATMNLPNAMYEADTSEILAAYGNIQSYGARRYVWRVYSEGYIWVYKIFNAKDSLFK